MTLLYKNCFLWVVYVVDARLLVHLSPCMDGLFRLHPTSSDIVAPRGGGSLPLIFFIRMCSRFIYQGAIYLVEKITSYKGKCLCFITPIKNYNILGESIQNTLFYWLHLYLYVQVASLVRNLAVYEYRA